MLVAINLAGPLSTVFTITELSIAGFNIYTVQVRTTVDPIGRTGLGVLLDNLTETGPGTAEKLASHDMK